MKKKPKNWHSIAEYLGLIGIPTLTVLTAFLIYTYSPFGMNLWLMLFFLGIVLVWHRISNYQNTHYWKRALRKLIRDKHTLEKEKTLLERNQNDFSNQFGLQDDTILLLYSQLRKIARGDFTQGIDTLLETVEIFTQCTRASLWKFDTDENRLILVNFLGYEQSERPFPYRPVSTTLQGWALRNNRSYSLRMLQDYPNLFSLDDKSTIMVLPFSIQNKPWGVISIEAMPFERYNQFTETLLNILLRLVEPGLDRLYDFELTMTASEWDDSTGLPQYGMLIRNLTENLTLASRHHTRFSLVVLEVRNPQVDELNHQSTKEYMTEFIEYLDDELPDQFRVFHFKEDNQIALYIPNVDEDGTAMLCMNILSLTSATFPGTDLIIGYSCSRGNNSLTAHDIVKEVEHLLEIQKI